MSEARMDPNTPILGVAGGHTVGDFWAWAFSNILTNNLRGIFAEFLVGTALEALEGVPDEGHRRVSNPIPYLTALLVYSLVCCLFLYPSASAATSSRQKSGMSGTTRPQTR